LLDNKNIALALEENAGRRASHPAIIEGDRTIPYSELDSLVRRIAGHLGDQGIGEGAIVGVCLRDSANHLMVLYAVARLGAVILPLDWRWTGPEKRRVAEYFGVALVVVEAGAELAGVASIEMSGAWHAAIAKRQSDAPCAAGGARPVVLSLSSGTTGRPKGPALTHDQFIARFIIQWVSLGFNQHDRYLSATPIYFGGGRSFAMGSLFSGGTVILFPPPYEPSDLIEAASKYEATTLLLVPTLLRQLLELPDGGAPLLAGLNRLLSTGAILHPDERQAVLDRLNPNFINYYGSTEGGGTSVLLPKHSGAAAASVGEPIYQTEIQIVGEDGAEKPAGVAGHIRYRGPAVATSFYNDPEASAEAFRDGWFYPGDIGKVEEDGLLYLVGRAKDVIIRSGVNIYPAEIEQILLDHPAVGDAVAVPWPHPKRGEDVAVFVVLKGLAEEQALLDHCRANLASYKVPRGIFFIEEMPKTALGKIIKPELTLRLVTPGETVSP
jgi:acyl-CoA synthetase (AMP-forming)/AMP-acid ligase II